MVKRALWNDTEWRVCELADMGELEVYGFRDCRQIYVEVPNRDSEVYKTSIP